ncbi:Protein-tyrosine-phosphatase PTP1 [Heracleum sosnowskyi]|uniref:protein-tyrosine-phosphatase n=1 Tax=Heracleum sosnowskyi TaxID=360622 RepID=A0AAD8M737_9APIA|nr:Protein-tyrosine-phosphatase PTP1 [Heracleum sosnowskyi]
MSAAANAVNTLDDDLKLSLTTAQIEFCSEALKFLKNKRINQSLLLEHEFASLPRRDTIFVDDGLEILEEPHRFSVAYSEKNMNKNRYTDVVPFDTNLVRLNPCRDYRPSATGYINASFIAASASKSVSQFIATQDPIPETYEDFWEMVLQHRCPVIVMLTPFVDNEKNEKCGDYYQTTDGPREFGNICITTKSIETTKNNLVLRNLEVNYKESEEPPLSVLHVLYRDWPDKGVPEGTLALRKIWRRLSTVPPVTGPILVHCSAGIGRTGTYCTVHNTLQRILVRDFSALDIVKTVNTFRLQRTGMVQTEAQYYYCYDAIIQELEDLISEHNGHKSS